ncbi:hypothetical protein MYBA111488_24635 [Mycobacterium basiliense]
MMIRPDQPVLVGCSLDQSCPDRGAVADIAKGFAFCSAYLLDVVLGAVGKVDNIPGHYRVVHDDLDGLLEARIRDSHREIGTALDDGLHRFM